VVSCLITRDGNSFLTQRVFNIFFTGTSVKIQNHYFLNSEITESEINFEVNFTVVFISYFKLLYNFSETLDKNDTNLYFVVKLVKANDIKGN
jgi:hypothetical protein